MSLLNSFGLLAIVFIVGLAVLFIARLSALSARVPAGTQGRAGRYRPMLRLLSEEDLAPVRRNRKLMRRLRVERVAIFRGYARCMARDYGRLLAGLRLVAVHSPTDRPDLAGAILRNRILFAYLLCRLDVVLALHRLGVRGLDLSGVVEALDSIRVRTTAALSPASVRHGVMRAI